ncbi:MAG: XrtA/PEP-CTERM system TPR-repeat protein PrsT [Motiliproteus sp.]
MTISPSKRLRPLILALSMVSFTAFSADFYQDAQQYIGKGDDRAAVIQLKNLLQKSPKHKDGRALLGKLMFKGRQYPTAEKELRIAIDLGADKTELLPLLVRSQIRQGKTQLAFDTLTAEWDESTDPAQRKHVLGRIYLGRNKLTEAENAFYESLQLQKSPEPTLGLAFVARARGSLEEALGTLEPIINEAEVRLEALALKAEILLDLRRGEEAVGILSELIAAEPKQFPLKLARSRGYLLLADYKKATADLASLPAPYQQLPQTLLLSSLIAMGQEKYDEAYKLATAVLQVVPSSPRAMLIAGSSRYISKDYQIALKHLIEYVALIPNDPNGLRLLAATQQSLHQYTAALKTIEPLLQQAEPDARSAAIAGYAHISLGEWEKGEELLALALKKEPQLAKLKNQLVLSQIMTGRSDSAIESLSDEGTDDFQADSLKVIAYLQQQQFDKARGFLKNRIKTHPDEPSFRMLEGLVGIRQNDIESARNSYQQALQLRENFVPAMLALARLDMQQQKFAEAANAYQQILTIEPKQLAALMGMAQASEGQKNEKKMVRWLTKARDIDPDAIQPITSIIRYHISKQELEKARKEAYSYYSEHPTKAQASLLYISVLRASGSLGEATTLIEKLLETYPGQDIYHRIKAEILRDQRKPKEALVYSKKAIEIRPEAPANQLLHLDLLLLNGETKKAAPLAERLREKFKNPTTARMLGLVRLTQGRNQEAVKLLEEASKAATDGLLASALANAYQLQNQPLKGVDVLVKRLEQAPDEHNTRFRLATLYQNNAMHTEAIKEYEQLRDLQPENPIPWNNLAWLYQQRNDPRSADHAREALRLAPGRPDIKDTLGWILLDQEELDEALSLLKDAAKQLPAVDEVQYHYAMALVKKGHNNEAKVILKSLSQGKGPFKAPAQTLLNQIAAN